MNTIIKSLLLFLLITLTNCTNKIQNKSVERKIESIYKYASLLQEKDGVNTDFSSIFSEIKEIINETEMSKILSITMTMKKMDKKYPKLQLHKNFINWSLKKQPKQTSQSSPSFHWFLFYSTLNYKKNPSKIALRLLKNHQITN